MAPVRPGWAIRRTSRPGRRGLPEEPPANHHPAARAGAVPSWHRSRGWPDRPPRPCQQRQHRGLCRPPIEVAGRLRPRLCVRKRWRGGRHGGGDRCCTARRGCRAGTAAEQQEGGHRSCEAAAVALCPKNHRWCGFDGLGLAGGVPPDQVGPTEGCGEGEATAEGNGADRVGAFLGNAGCGSAQASTDRYNSTPTSERTGDRQEVSSSCTGQVTRGGRPSPPERRRMERTPESFRRLKSGYAANKSRQCRLADEPAAHLEDIQEGRRFHAHRIRFCQLDLFLTPTRESRFTSSVFRSLPIA
ncbi:hypothetical protein SA2016_2288 [Sinomonas atrocyanea]|uniref:Uncharacterized protein n=1 Tax=Sinomonas atrocyanea TaxID=37927 RepID=A0A127A1A9_9MICC|nr:hypothetical protein SA2016_2288 [Sinomonas atrocyanea]